MAHSDSPSSPRLQEPRWSWSASSWARGMPTGRLLGRPRRTRRRSRPERLDTGQGSGSASVVDAMDDAGEDPSGRDVGASAQSRGRRSGDAGSAG